MYSESQKGKCYIIIIKWVSESCSIVSDPLQPHRLYGPWNSSGWNTGVGSLSLLQGNLPNPEIEPRFPALQADSLPAESQGKPKNTGEGSLSLLLQIFPTQELNKGLLHCRWILYQLSFWEIYRSESTCVHGFRNNKGLR